MPRGGARPGSGGSRPGAGRKKSEVKLPPPDIRVASLNAGMSPLDYMLAVMRDDTADAQRRDRMAQAAAPYVHAKPAETGPGKKEQRDQVARTAERGTDWESLLQ